MEQSNIQLSLLLNMEDPDEVMDEVFNIIRLIYPNASIDLLNSVFKDTLKLFNGKYPGYRKCNVIYHTLKHTTDTMLAMVRLIHGANINKIELSEEGIQLGIITAMFHDTGYIQKEDDLNGTGAKYTLIHVQRSVNFLEKYFKERGFTTEQILFAINILNCTGLNVKINEIDFLSRENEILGKMLGTADLLGQMADRAYLEKLPYLYKEYKEGKVPGYNSELDLLEKTPEFYKQTLKRFKTEFGGVCGYMKDHFRVRWGIDRDLYKETIEKNMEYLRYILKNHKDEYKKYLRRHIKVEFDDKD